ncbi:MAG: hypothetical protein K0R80_2257 [Clostridia bacterium]|jgi:hypothetical protein|nr:hypothetical protein [Clostridia bacterium]
MSDDEIFKINERFLEIQISSSREILLSHNPVNYLGDGSFYAKELKFLIDNGYRFIKEGEIWRAFIKKKGYKYINELEYTKKLIAAEFIDEMVILSVGFSEEHVTQPAYIRMKFLPLNYDVEITFDSNFINSIITNKNQSLPLHRYLINEGRYSETLFRLTEGGNNSQVIDTLVKELKLLLHNGNLYFYYWDGDKLYKRQGTKVKRLKIGEF